jgi:hypothetical protein
MPICIPSFLPSFIPHLWSTSEGLLSCTFAHSNAAPFLGRTFRSRFSMGWRPLARLGKDWAWCMVGYGVSVWWSVGCMVLVYGVGCSLRICGWVSCVFIVCVYRACIVNAYGVGVYRVHHVRCACACGVYILGMVCVLRIMHSTVSPPMPSSTSEKYTKRV